MKNYLSLNERNTWLASMVLTMHNEDVIKAWSKNLTKEEVKKLKTSITMTKNALKSISDRMPDKEKDRIVKHSKDFEVRILTTVGAKVLQNRADKDSENVEVNRVEFENIIQELIVARCANCNINCNQCNIYEFFIKTMIPRFEVKDNCPFAITINKEPKKRSRKDKKTKNRFDDDGEEYEYNLKSKRIEND